MKERLVGAHLDCIQSLVVQRRRACNNTHTAAMSADALATAVRETLAEAAASGAEMTARNVRHAVEKKLGLPQDGLLDRKEELMGLISHATGKSSWA